MMKAHSQSTNQDGFTLVEVVVSMMILSVVLVSLAAVTFQTARRSLGAQGVDQRQAVLMQQINLFSAVPYDSLTNAAFIGCTTVTATFPYTRCASVTALTATVRQVTVVVTPTRATVWSPDTAIIFRSKTPVNPLNM